MEEELFGNLVSDLREAIRLQEEISKLGVHPRLHLTSSLGITLHLDLGDKHNLIRDISKVAHAKLDKQVTSSGFLKYNAQIGKIRLYANTRECFYGGTPIIEAHPRTKAYCLVHPKGAKNHE